MKKLRHLLKKRSGFYQHRPVFKEYLERHFEIHGSHYIIITITLATCVILLQAMWSVYSLLK